MNPVEINSSTANDAQEALGELSAEVQRKLAINPNDKALKAYAYALEQMACLFNASGLGMEANKQVKG
jgi:hypothetical protein